MRTMARFTLPRDVYHGKGCLEELKNLKGKKAILVVGGGSMKRQGFLDKAVGYLKEAGMEVQRGRISCRLQRFGRLIVCCDNGRHNRGKSFECTLSLP